MEYDKKCVYCGKRYRATRNDSKTCSSTCRVKFNSVKNTMIEIGTLPVESNGKGGFIYIQKDLDDLCKGTEHCKLYLQHNNKNDTMKVYAIGCDPKQKHCSKSLIVRTEK
jgi:hypothetical protein